LFHDTFSPTGLTAYITTCSKRERLNPVLTLQQTMTRIVSSCKQFEVGYAHWASFFMVAISFYNENFVMPCWFLAQATIIYLAII